MIKLPTLLETDLKQFEGKQVLFYTNLGWVSVKNLYGIFKYLNIQTVGYYSDIKPTYRQKVKNKMLGVRYLGFNDVMENYDNVILQSVDFDVNHVKNARNKALEWGCEYSELPCGQISESFYANSLLGLQNAHIKMIGKKYESIYNFSPRSNIKLIKFIMKTKDSPVIVCSPQKTGDHTLDYTFDMFNTSCCDDRQVEYLNLYHNPYGINKRILGKTKKIKILMGVREPISQAISLLYQMITDGSVANRIFRCDLLFYDGDIKFWDKYRQLSMEKDDVQVKWDVLEAFYVRHCDDLNKLKRIGYIQENINGFRNHVVDIFQYPFNKEKGYTIIREGNIEVFVYQLEKLDFLLPELSEWIGIKFENWERRNVASNKWVGESYKEALKKIKISREYFEICFNDDYVKHCYSESDIENFKARWISHIKD